MKKCLTIIISVFFGFILGLFLPKIPSWFSTTDAICPDGVQPDKNGCCPGEVYTDMYDLGFNCCPEDGEGDCFPPLR